MLTPMSVYVAETVALPEAHERLERVRLVRRAEIVSRGGKKAFCYALTNIAQAMLKLAARLQPHVEIPQTYVKAEAR